LSTSVVPHERTNATSEASVGVLYSCRLIVDTFLFVTLCFSSIAMPKATYSWKGKIVTESTYEKRLAQQKLAIVSATLRDSVVGIATSYGLDDQGVGVRVPVGSRIFSSPRSSDRLWGPPNLITNWYRGVKRPGREAHLSPAVSAQVKKMWICTSIPPYAFIA
jgi:hypothetical protein